jgi:hypothetical protein
MAIVLISGSPRTGKSLIANALRNNAISFGNGALLIDENVEAEPKALLEKIIKGVPLSTTKIEDLPWKHDPQIILVGNASHYLALFEELVPGFRVKFGPVYGVRTE